MQAASIVVPAQMVYMNIPATELRMFTDGLFPSLAVNHIADSARGFGHRYVAGHDLFLDVPKTFTSYGPSEGLSHAGHILLTDFPTKAGIPIPFLSKSGLGRILEQAGIHRGWLQVNILDAGVGVLAIAEGSSNLAQAIYGNLVMNWGTFFHTFVEGGIELEFGLACQNPFLLVGGLENVLAGIVATWNKLTIHVDPLEFFGSAGISALIGFGLAYGLAGEDLSSAGADAIRSGIVGALFSMSSAFGFGALAGFATFRLGQKLAEIHNEPVNGCFSIDRESYNLLVEEICKGNPNVTKLLELALPRLIFQERAEYLPVQGKVLPENCKTLPDDGLKFKDTSIVLKEETSYLNTETNILPDDPRFMAEWYQSALGG